jgi:predicted phosphodiesterase
MRYAIFSDIHANIHALQSVLADAKANGADRYLFNGDYGSLLPYPNETAETLRNLADAVIVRGNNEDHLMKDGMDCQQMRPVYWAIKHLTLKNYEYLTTLPEKITITDGGVNIHLSHSNFILDRTLRNEYFSSHRFDRLMKANPFTHDEYLHHAKNAVLSAPDLRAEFDALPKGIYLFGHNHLQFHMEHNSTYLINPGSVGFPCDWKTTAPYTLLTITNGKVEIDERRVEYDIQAVIDGMESTGYALYAPTWCKIITSQLKSGRDYFSYFLGHLNKINKQSGDGKVPVTDEIFNTAAKTWEENKNDD